MTQTSFYSEAELRAIVYRNIVDGREHLTLVKGDVGGGRPALVRLHSECLTGDVFGSLRCDCGPQLDAALAAVAREGRGVVLSFHRRAFMLSHPAKSIGGQ